ncbi:MAG TPA: hypothetical protein VJY62_08865 [Bacteroidia bacterium]|nr:hypothetical protein [Bacteroidia bacterium]
MKKICIISLLFLFSAGSLFAQKKPPKPPQLSKDQVKAMKKDADEFFKNENYKEALIRYKNLQVAEPDDVDVNYKLGVSYLKTNIDKKQAAVYLKNVIGRKDAPKDALYYEAQALFFNNEFNEAIDNFEKYNEANHGKTNPKLMLNRHIEWCHNALDLMKKPVDVRFDNLGKSVNSPTADYRPVVGANDTMIYFSSNRKGNLGGLLDGFGEYLTDVYYTTNLDTSWTKAKSTGTNINTETYDEAMYLSPNGEKMLVYREGGDASGEIYYTELKGKQWNKIIPFGEQIESKGKIPGACLSPDGRTVYFVADMKGTKGGMDIWKSEKDTGTGKWSAPVNLGDGINTAFDEMNPFIFPDGKTLFFASQGHNSMGGFDMFKSVQPDPRQGWSKAENLGYPVNTVFDDNDLQLNGTGMVGYISAHRDDGYGETDIYKLTFKQSQINPPCVFVKIRVMSPSGLPVKEAICTVTRKSTGELLGTLMSNMSTGIVNYSLPAGDYRIKIRSPKIGKADEDFEVKGDEKGNKKVLVYVLK